MKKTLGIYGSGGLGREVLVIAKRLFKWNEIIFIDDDPKSSQVNEVEVFTFDHILDHFKNNNLSIIIALGEPTNRKTVYKKVIKNEFDLVNVFYKNFQIPLFSSLGTGNIIHLGTILVTDIKLGDNCFINKNCVIGHDVTIGSNVVISPSATIGGETTIGNQVYIGSGAVIRDHISIGDNAIIGMGSVVVKDVPKNAVVVGNPGKIIRYNDKNKVFNN